MNMNKDNLKIAYIGGGSNNWARILMNDLAQDDEISGEVRLYDIDFQSALENEQIGNKIIKSESWNYQAVKTIEDCLEDADFVFISILPGTFEDMMIDVHAPEKYGVYQSVGDTVGLGGISRSWRTVPMLAEIAKKIKVVSPNSWVINFTNPMSICIKTLYEVFPEIKAYGCCHEVFDTQKLLKTVLEKEIGIEGIQFKDIKTNVIGINHFTWIDKASYKDIDILPIYKQFVEKNYTNGFNETDQNWFNNHFKSSERVKFDLFKKYGLIAAAGDRHLAEFVDNDIYIHNNKEWKFALTPVQWRIDERKKLIENKSKLLNGEIPFKFKDSGEDFIRQMKALLGIFEIVTNVNLPNVGQIKNLDKNIVTETNAVFSKNGVFPIVSGIIPETIRKLILPHASNQKIIVEASLKRDEKMLFEAFKNDPQAKGLSKENLKNLFSEMISER